MARPPKVGLDYFPHDTDLSDDEKVEMLEAVYGNDGYTVYLKLLERIYRAGGSLSIADEDTVKALSKKCNVTEERFLAIVAFCGRKQLFSQRILNRYKRLTSPGILKRMVPIETKRLKNQEKYRRVSAAETRLKPGRNSAETPQSKVKESKVKERNTNTKGLAFEIPEWVPKDTFGAFMEMRKSIKKPLTPHAVKLAVAELDRLRANGDSVEDIINQSILNSWQGFYALKTKGASDGKQFSSHAGLDRKDYRKGLEDF